MRQAGTCSYKPVLSRETIPAATLLYAQSLGFTYVPVGQLGRIINIAFSNLDC